MRARHRFVGLIGLTVGSVLISLLALEMTLRRWPTLLGSAFANGAVSRYTAGQGGIYYFDRGLGMYFMIPNHRTVMSYNGYTWMHWTDSLGFRNEPLHIPADVILLGDSVVYGHGVDYEHTFGYYLERRSGLQVANLGRQGDSAFQEAYLLTAYVALFKPRFVVHVFTPNDIDDLYTYLTNAAMEAFIAQPIDRITYPPRTDPERLLRERERSIRQRSIVKRAAENLYLMKMLRWLHYTYREWRASAGGAAALTAPAGRRPGSADVGTDPASLGWRYMEHALAYMNHVAAHAGARLLMAPIAQGRQLEILRGIAARHAIDVIDTAPVFTGPTFLPNDGHFTPHGARVMAEITAAYLERLPPAVPPRVVR
jgi:hypothetical protein